MVHSNNQKPVKNPPKGTGTTGVGIAALILSFSTLICCVIPILLVSVGLGAVIAAIIGQLPVIAELTQYKLYFFIASGMLLTLTAWLIWRPGKSCPSDPKLAALCNAVDVWNKRIFWTALTLWSIGTVVTYVLLPLLLWLEGY